MSVTSVGNPLAEELTSLSTRQFILEKGLISVANVEKPLIGAPALLNTAGFTLERGHMCVTSVENLLGRSLTSFNIR
jgi:hypothetical protein